MIEVGEAFSDRYQRRNGEKTKQFQKIKTKLWEAQRKSNMTESTVRGIEIRNEKSKDETKNI